MCVWIESTDFWAEGFIYNLEFVFAGILCAIVAEILLNICTESRLTSYSFCALISEIDCQVQETQISNQFQPNSTLSFIVQLLKQKT